MNPAIFSLLLACDPSTGPHHTGLDAPAGSKATDTGGATTNQVDVLFALDSSCSMADDAAALEAAFNTHLTVLTGQGLDWQAALVTGDDGCTGGVATAAGPRSVRAVFNDTSDYGSQTERLLTLADTAAEQSDKGECNEGLLRPGAMVHVIAVSDEPDQSVKSWDVYVDAMIARKGGDASLVKYSAVAGDYPSGCGSASVGLGYYEAAADTGGLYLSICSTTWRTHLKRLAFASVP